MEIVIVDDGSSDNTRKVIEQVTDERIRLITVKNGGAAAARNIAYKNSGGAYIIFFDADDHVNEHFVSSQYESMQGGTDIVVLSAWGRFYQDDLGTFVKEEVPQGEITFEAWINTYWYHCNPMTTPGRVIIPRPIIAAAGLWNTDLSLNDDMEFYTRIFLKAAKIRFNNNAVLYYRSGIEGLSSKKCGKEFQSLFNSIELSTGFVLNCYRDDQQIRRSCANMYQYVLYEVYPDDKPLQRAAKARIRDLGGSTYPYPAAGLTKFLLSVIGWKLAKRLKIKLKQLFTSRHADS